MLVVAVLFALLPIVRPSVVFEHNGTWHALGRHRQVLVDVELWASTPLELLEILPVAGAEAAEAWIHEGPLSHPQTDLDPEAFPSGQAYVEALFERTPSAGDALPATVPRDKELRLLILWDVIDCAFLSEHDQPQARFRTAFRTIVQVPIAPSFASPALDVQTLQSTGTCG